MPAIDIATASGDGLDELDFDRGMPRIRSFMTSLILILCQDDQDNLNRHAALKAREHVMIARARAKQFDVNAAREREKNEALAKSRSLFDTSGLDVAQSKPAAPLINCESFTDCYGDARLTNLCPKLTPMSSTSRTQLRWPR